MTPRHALALTIVLGGLPLAGCGTTDGSPAASPEGHVSWVGEQHRAVHDGDFGGKVRLADLAERPHLYAIGPVERLTGEITVLDGEPAIATVDHDEFGVRASLDCSAAFLVWTYASRWDAAPLPDSVRTMAQLEDSLVQLVQARGGDVAAPFAFRIDGQVQDLKFHVLNRAEGSPSTFEAHEKSKVHGSVAGRSVRLIGFHSTAHRGVFTPGTSDLHIHFVADDGKLSGHVEDFTLLPGASLLSTAVAR